MGHSPLQNTIRRLRFNHAEMTQEALAKAVGATRQTIIALEANKYVPSLLLAMKIARFFGVPVEEVFLLPENDRGSAVDSTYPPASTQARSTSRGESK